ncbi:ammonium transporter [Leptolyngbya sp. Heron Island J]|uniref:ammonium transporter n=1 Tax=Leptolyngbya sp. Heron Island J TaxID=1385935 RepID=UPI0003B96735|nr:ammonium transporter [Leptolyngbya sp. Heron Island J]ESA38574.1 ammonium transporter [Leptolyngbya sp. Heron Island J]
MNSLFKRLSKHKSFTFLVTVSFLTALSSQAFGQEPTNTIPLSNDFFSAINTIWMMIAALLVFFMNAGFAMLEAGICRTENATNILAKNLIVFCVAATAFFIFGFRFMFGDSSNPVFGQFGILVDSLFPSEVNLNPFPQGFENLRFFWQDRSFAAIFFFQLSFAGTTATIVSGAVAERIKFWGFILFSFVLAGFIYPLVGYWVWGDHGWLASVLNFHDFAGSTVIHCVGGTAALVGAWILRPRHGKFGYDSATESFPYGEEVGTFEPCNPGFTTLGCLILWVGWFGFNGGSTRFLEYVPHVLITTVFASTSGGLAILLYSPLVTGYKVKLSSIINGILGGLVSITASSAYVDILGACIIGAVGGVLVLLGESLFQSNLLRIDDPVSAVPVHLFCGIWGTVAVGIFSQSISREFNSLHTIAQQTFYQFLGCSCVILTTLLLSLLAWMAIGLFLYYLNPSVSYHYSEGDIGVLTTVRRGLRVTLEDEKAGSDATIIM